MIAPQGQKMIMQGSADKLVRDIRVVVQGAEDLIKATSGDAEEKTREARARLAGALAVARDSLNTAEQTAAEGARATDTFIRDYPYHALGMVFLTGLFVGVLASRR